MKDALAIASIVAEVLSLDREETMNLSPETDLREFDLNSMSAVDLVVLLEQRFGIEVEEEDLLIDRLCTPAAIERLVMKYKGLPAGGDAR